MSREITDGVFSVGAIDWHRETFDEIIPLPDGTSYNSYLIKGKEKIALIDAVDPATTEQLFYNLEELKISKIDYIISNHAEQDHSGGIVDVLEKYKGAKVVTNSKCKNMLKELLLLKDEDFIEVKEGDTLDLGGKTLEFILTPWVHWPETMVTYLKEDKILFSCDFFGSHLATSSLFADEKEVYEKAKRYYAEIMYPFRNNVLNNIKKVEKYDINMIAPSHGPVYKNPQFIIDAYKDWSSDNVKNEVIVVYVSMHHSVKKMADYVVSKLMDKNIKVKYFNLSNADIGEVAISLVDAATILIGSPTFLAGAHPHIVNAVNIVNALRPKTKFAGIFTSFGWGEKASETILNILTNFKGEVLDVIKAKGYPKENDFKKLDDLVDKVYEKHKSLNLI